MRTALKIGIMLSAEIFPRALQSNDELTEILESISRLCGDAAQLVYPDSEGNYHMHLRPTSTRLKSTVGTKRVAGIIRVCSIICHRYFNLRTVGSYIGIYSPDSFGVVP